jgi:hypothetical protein
MPPKHTLNRALLFLFLCLSTSEVIAQGFNVFNNRNHPYLNWQVAETEHFEIIYPERISGIEAEAAAIAEESYRALSKNMGVELPVKVRIYLADIDEISNGFANPIGRGYTMIWVNLNDFSISRTGQAKWLRHVIAHELAHIFHFNAVWSNMGLLNYSLGSPTPIFWTEGIAQYQTETWNSQRGDRWLRKAIFDSRPEYRSDQSIEDGRLMYAVGNSQLRYFTEKYGDSTLTDMMAHRNKRFGLFEYHDFDEAFREHVDGGYNEFYEEWRKHMNVHYNTMASQMGRTDSLNSERFQLPGQFYFDMAVSPGDSLIAVLSMPSIRRPVRYLHVVKNDSTLKSSRLAEGAINPDLNWSLDGKKIYYSRRVRGERSALLNDIFQLNAETGRETQLTQNRRAMFPAPGPGEDEISYIVNEDGTGNLFTLNLLTGIENRVTSYEGDIQLHWSRWIDHLEKWLIYRFDENGNRNLILLDPDTGFKQILDEGQIDNRRPVLSPDHKKIAFTSLRDDVPNVFIYDFETDSTRRVTNLFTGGEVFGWIAESDTLETEKLLIQASETKRRDYLYWVDAERKAEVTPLDLPEAYSGWRMKSPPNEIPFNIQADESLILNRYRYSSFSNITHAVSLAAPYIAGKDNWGLFATTNWVEPMGNHLFSAIGWVSVANPSRHSYGAINYMNNQFYPTSLLSIYRVPGNSKFYGNRFLIQELTGGQLTLTWPLDLFSGSYRGSSLEMRLRHILVNPLNSSRFEEQPIPNPVKGRQTDLSLEWTLKKQRPWRDNGIHPLDGNGLKVNLLGADKILGSDVRFLSADLNAFTVLPSVGLHRIYLQGRYQQQWGELLPQDYIGFSHYDNITVSLPQQFFVQLFQDSERVRGYREFVSGNRVLFGSMEYRIPFLSSLETTLLGILSLGATSLALFSDAGIVWNATDQEGNNGTEHRWGAGAEIKNEVRFFGVGVTHALGIAQPAHQLFGSHDPDIYYRIRAVVPF